MKRSTLSVSLFALSVTAFSPGPALAEKHFEGIPRFRDTPGDGDGLLAFEILDAPEGVTLVAQPDPAAPVLKRFKRAFSGQATFRDRIPLPYPILSKNVA